MSDVMNSIFGRPKNENPDAGGYAYGSVEPEPAVAEESAPEAETTTETAEDETADAVEDTADSEAAEHSEEDVAETEEDDTDSNAAEDEDEGEAAEEAVAETEEPAEAVAEAEPAAVAEPAAEAEPVAVAEAEPAAARPAAGSRGSTTIADGVVGKIVLRIAGRTEGVHSVAEDGVKVELADDVAWVTIPVVIEFGHAVKALGEQLRVAVIDAVEQYLGLDVEVVDVHVTDIHFPEAD
ncbi:Asp23/Gls24 family envelope stress response protein [Amycolatopsis tolypomycina]|uniref:Uncharacterized conserved protein YloU, alkaline shock protein (Asp23) family n=1 Tax=Amycolatopsis tolypomycina TaxID=208445 RepID=A0A1H4W5H9_9PSEU|nr:Asp23/Gls24 family envelope stress response protein [Amycolatopsis tolypomycina]SEC88483.1 Uncharacterized conserved protein YloU, alkaline shock protein (Asp23) family [Amycolatopsis tolypomycina]